MVKFYFRYFGFCLIGVLVSSCISALFTALFGLLFGGKIICFVFSIIGSIFPALIFGGLGVDTERIYNKGKNPYFITNQVKINKVIFTFILCMCFFAGFLVLTILGFDKIYSGKPALFIIDGFGALLSFCLFCGVSTIFCIYSSKCKNCNCVLCQRKIGLGGYDRRESTETKTKVSVGSSKVGSVYSGNTKIGDVYQDHSSSRDYSRKVVKETYKDIYKCLHCGRTSIRTRYETQKSKWE